MESITNLFIPTGIFQDERLTFLQKGVLAIEAQYPHATVAELSGALGITTRHFHRLKHEAETESVINVTLEGDTEVTVDSDVQVTPQTAKTTSNDSGNVENSENDSDVQVTPKYDVQVTPESDITKLARLKQKAQTHEENVQKMLKYIMRIDSREDYEKKKNKIKEAWQHTELYTEDDLVLFDEKLTEKLSEFEDL